ncbi:MAG TPA: NrfD/PsrC family molybdoenzyme membrane anchor subunit [Ktedonobacteraceae bacterium]|nr:NrfD/PsrC family molybdoenzyme membrane anchor subunit [Ktedonobacteraceae bacterium]
MRANTLAEQLATLITGYTPDLEREQQEPTYYDYPVLKAPIWRWEIVWYFFLGGLAAGCYVIASIAALFGSQEDRVVARTGYYLSLLALLPCPPLLIKDLGRPERFLNMLRVFKVKSPMSMREHLWYLKPLADTRFLVCRGLSPIPDTTCNLTMW